MIDNLTEGVDAFTSNVFLVTGERTVLVDTGANVDVTSRIEERVEGVDAVVLTHTHPDHVGNLAAVTDRFDAPAWGFDPERSAVDRRIEDEADVRMGDHAYVALHTPGHASDHLCFYSSAASILFSGDLVFRNGSFGRTDLAGADRATLIESIDRVLDRVDRGLGELHPGHGPSALDDAYRHLELARDFAAET